jgi:hypothetical protein
MAKQLRIDEIVEIPGGGFDVRYTYGDTPLDANPSGLSVTFPSRQAVREAIQSLETRFTVEDMILMRVAQHVRATADTTITNRAALKNRTITLDFGLAGAAPIDMR